MGMQLLAAALATTVMARSTTGGEVDHSKVPGAVIDHSPASSGKYIGSPSIAVLPDGSYVASHDFFGPGTPYRRMAISRVFRSEDRGKTWTQTAELVGQFWSTLFTHRGALYILGTRAEYAAVIIRRSSDGGRTWSEPTDRDTGILAEGQYHTAPVPVIVHGERLWRAMEIKSKKTRGWGGEYFQAGVMSAPVDADLLRAESWTVSEPLARPDAVPGRAWLEGNVVVTPGGELWNMLRITAGSKAAVTRIADDGRSLSLHPGQAVVNFPGGAKKFTIRHDDRTGLYWTLVNPVLPEYRKHNPASVRNTLAVMTSPDLKTWTVHKTVLHHPDVRKHGFQYVDWVFDGRDIAAVSRTAFDDGLGGAHSAHDANFMTFHRIREFRKMATGSPSTPNASHRPLAARERQLTSAPCGHILTNVNVFSPDGKWIVYDVRSDPAGSVFDGTRIERVSVETDQVEVLYESVDGACCGVVTASPVEDKVVFIHGPEKPTGDWQYAAYHRRGMVVDAERPGRGVTLDARDLTAPFTPGALRGGTHVHVFSGDGRWVSFTYEDAVLAEFERPAPGRDLNQRNVGVCVPHGPVAVRPDHPRNHDGAYFTVLVTRTVNEPAPGSDEISKAFSDAWVGTRGYLRPDGTRQERAIVFQGLVQTADGRPIAEAFIVDLPENVTVPGDGPLEGTATRRPAPPKGTVQRRLTRTAGRKHPGIQGPRHWLRSSPDGSRIALLMKDDAGVVQLWTVSPNGGPPVQVTHNEHDIGSAFTWSRDGRWIAHVMDNSVCVTDVPTGRTHRLTRRFADAEAPRPEACVFSPDGRRIAYVRRVTGDAGRFNQIFTVPVREIQGRMKPHNRER
jgi:hypothetical protein